MLRSGQFVFCFCSCTLPLLAQRNAGELRLQVLDPTGAGVQATGELVSYETQVRRHFTTSPEGTQILSALPFARYHLTIQRSGFQPASALIDIRSELPVSYTANLGLVPIATEVQVSDAETLLNPDRTGALQHIAGDTLRDRLSAAPGRGVLNLVDTQPGWLLEANGVLHPRGSEYGVQYVVDGLPLFDNRSPVFAPSLDVQDFQSLNIRTGGYPAEYGHQLGGVIEVTTSRDTRPGLHGKAEVQGGSFAAINGYVSTQYVQGKNTFGLSADAMQSDRYLDPPVEQNYTNHASGSGLTGRVERDWNDADRTRMQVRHSRTGFLVPNESLQEEAGQRQDRTAQETSGQIAHTHLFSEHVLGDVRGLARDVSADLWSNPLSTPIAPAQQRRFREAYTSASVVVHHGAHEIKAGTEAIFRSIEEQFSYRIITYRLNGLRIFDRETPRTFEFSDHRQNREQSVYLQDQIRLGAVTLSAGLRWDHYRLIVDEHAFSPRLAAAWQAPKGGLVLRASYDRAFQTPAIENLLLASSPALLVLHNNGLGLPVRPSRGNFYEAGFSKSVFNRARLDASYFRRNVDNFADDSLLLNTGVSFPIAFAHASIYGVEAKIEVPRWGPVSGFISYTNLLGRGRLPIAGGLFLEDQAAQLLQSTEQFAITQDQRNTARARIRYQVLSRLWAAAGAQYGTGLPVELDEGTDTNVLREQYGQRVLDRVNLDRGRVRPSFSIDLSAGADLWKREARALRLQADVFNVTNRLNVINFAGLFSGTALEPPRWAALRLQIEF